MPAVKRKREAQRVGSVSDFPDGSVQIREIGSRSVGIFNLGGEFFALRNSCPHQGAPLCRGRIKGTMSPSDPGQLVYGMDNEVIRCPWHGWEFSIRTGEAVFGISDKRAVTYETIVQEGDVFVLMAV